MSLLRGDSRESCPLEKKSILPIAPKSVTMPPIYLYETPTATLRIVAIYGLHPFGLRINIKAILGPSYLFPFKYCDIKT